MFLKSKQISFGICIFEVISQDLCNRFDGQM